ncbi:MAG: BatA domain-containing protein [Bacteroidales bacterium]|nr:BatA domain-containing protein [Bacteroidales bacterium]
MEFVNPGFLYGLFAISIPVIIHLFNFRRFKKVYFTNVAIIKELKQQTQKQSKLKHLLILLMRILAIAALVLAFSRPFIPTGQNLINPEESSSISVFVDNSFIMQAESDRGLLLENAKERAREVVSVFKNSDRFQLLTHDFEGRHQRFFSKDEFNSQLDEIKISPSSRNISEITIRQEELFKQEQSKVKASFIISDFQKGFVDKLTDPQDSTLQYYLIPVEAYYTNNLFIDSCWFGSPVSQVNQQVKLFVKIKNSSETTYEKIPLKLTINGVQKAIASFNSQPEAETIVELAFTNYKTGIQQGELKITDHPIVFDDEFYFTFNVASRFDILCINGSDENKYLNTLFKMDTLFHFKNVREGHLDFSDLPNYNLIIFNELEQISSGLLQEISRYLNNGGNLVVVPSDEIDILSYNNMLAEFGAGAITGKDSVEQKIVYLNAEHPLYSDVFEEFPENINLPGVSNYYVFNFSSKSSFHKLLGLQNGNIFLSSHNAGAGTIYLFATPFNSRYGNFPKHAVFVPTLYKMAISSFPSQKLFYTLGDDQGIRVYENRLAHDQVLKITDKNKTLETIPEHRQLGALLELFPHDQLRAAGNYFIVLDELPVQGVSFNYNRAESVMDFYSIDELLTRIKAANSFQVQAFKPNNKPFVKSLTEMSQGILLWKWFILAALLFLLAEVILLRVWR